MHCISLSHTSKLPPLTTTLLPTLSLFCDRISQSWRSGICPMHSNWVQGLGLSLEDSQGKRGLSAHWQILHLLGTQLYANNKGVSSRKMGGCMTYGLVRATPQVAVPPHAQSVLAAMHSDQVQCLGTDCTWGLALAGQTGGTVGGKLAGVGRGKGSGCQGWIGCLRVRWDI
jgi:hypothetical protein